MNKLQLSNLKHARNKRVHECPGANVRLIRTGKYLHSFSLPLSSLVPPNVNTFTHACLFIAFYRVTLHFIRKKILSIFLRCLSGMRESRREMQVLQL